MTWKIYSLETEPASSEKGVKYCMLSWEKHQLEIWGKMSAKHTRALTQYVLQVTVLEIFNIFVLAEEILVDVSPSEEPHVGVVGDGPVRVVIPVQSCTLSLGLHRRNQKGHAKEPQQLLVAKEYSHPQNKH